MIHKCWGNQHLSARSGFETSSSISGSSVSSTADSLSLPFSKGSGSSLTSGCSSASSTCLICLISDKWSLKAVFYSFFCTCVTHVSQYFSMSIAPSPTVNNASWVALLPQVTQNFVFPPSSTNDLSVENILSILLFHIPEDFVDCISWQYCNCRICSNHGFWIVSHHYM